MNRCFRLASSKCFPFQLAAPLGFQQLRGLLAMAAVFAFCLAAMGQSAHFGGVTSSFNFKSPSWLPLGVAVDSQGDLFIADGQLGKIYEVQAVNGVLPDSPTPVAIAKGFNQPYGLAFDGSGNLFVADAGNGAIKEIVAIGGVIAPNSSPQTVYSNASSWPSDVAVDANGNVFFTDQYAPKAVYEIVADGSGKVSKSSYVQTLAPNSFSWAWGIFVDAQGNLFVTDYNLNTVTEIVASNGSVSSNSALQPVASDLSGPRDIVADASGNLFIAEYGNEDLIEIAARSWIGTTPTPRVLNGGFYDPTFLAPGLRGEIYVADTNHYLVKTITVDPPDFGSVAVGSSSATFQIPFTFDSNTTLGGTAVFTYGATGKDFAGASGCQANTAYTAGQTCLLAVQFSPQFPGLRLGSAQLRDTNGNILASAPLHGVGTAPQLVFLPAQPAPKVLLSSPNAPSGTASLPWGVAVDANKNVYFADPNNYTIGMLNGGTQQETLFPFDYYFSTPRGIALDGAGNLFVADSDIGTVSEIQAGSNGQISATSNVITVASGFSSPVGIAVDGLGNVFVSDSGYNAVYEIVADSAGQVTSSSATLTIASSFSSPSGLALGANGNLYIADTGNGAVKEIVAVNGHVSSTSQVITVITQFQSPIGVAVDAAGNVYVSDSGSETINVTLTRGGTLSTSSLSLTLDSGLSSPTGVAVSANGDVYFADQGTGLLQQLTLSTPPPELDFPTPTAVGTVDTVDGGRSLTLVNIGNTILNFSLAGAGASDSLALSSDFFWGGGMDCSPYGSLTLARGSDCEPFISFKPTVSGPISGSLSFQSNSLNAASPGYAPVSIALYGTGTTPPVITTTYTVTFMAGANGSVMGMTTQTVLSGSSTTQVYVQPDPDAGFQWWVDGNGNYYSSDWGIVISNVTANQSFTALFYLAQVQGTCGSANGRNLSYAPGGQDLCSKGVASSVSGSGPWNWSCGGQNGGGTASCSASVKPACNGTQPCIVTVAGGGPNNLPALSSPLYYPDDVVGDSKGNIYIGNQEANRVFKVDPSGTLTVFAGNGESYSNGVNLRGDEGPAVNAEVSQTGLAIDANDNIYITDSFGSIRKVTTDGIIHTVAGGGNRAYYGDGVDARSAGFWDVEGMAFDRKGNMFIVDRHTNIIREITTDGIIHTVAGMPGTKGFSGDGGPATAAMLNDPSGVAVDSKGNVFVADTGSQRIRMFTVGGNISTVAGSETQQSNGDYYNDFQGDGGPATQALFSGPYNVAVDSQDRVYVADFWNGRVRRFIVGGNIDTIAGNGQGYSGDGPATSVGLSGPYGLAFDKDGNLLIGAQWDNLVRKLDFSSGNLTTVAGNQLAYLGGDGYAATQASLTTGSLTTGCYYMDVSISRNCPRVALDSASNLYIADSLNNSIRKVNAQTGIISTFAGSTAGISGYSGNGDKAYAAGLNTPMGMAFDANGTLYFADSQNNVVREIDTNNNIQTIAGNGSWGCGHVDNADATQGQLCTPSGVTVDLSGNVFVADSANCVIRKIAPPDNSGLRAMTTVAGEYSQGNCSASWPGNGAENLTGDSGPATSATLAYPMAVAVDQQGNLFIADSYNLAIRRVDAQTQVITTVAGASSQIGVPVDLALDGAGDIFFTQTNSLYAASTFSAPYVSELKPDGSILNIAGIGTPDFSGDGGPAVLAALDTPSGLALDAAGNLYIYDSGVGRVRKVNSVGQGGLPLNPQAIVNGMVTAYGKPLASVTITYQADTSTYQSGTTATDGNGNYSIAVTAGWSGTITPSLTGYNFTPSNNWVPAVTTSATQNFTAVITPPEVVTASTVGSASTTIASGGTVANEGGASVTARGVCFGTAANPAITGSCTSDGSGAGIFTSTLTGLALNTTYHARAFASSAAGTFYGSDVQFTTMNPSTSSAAGAYAYVTGFDTNTVSVIDTASQRVLSTVDLNPVGPTWYGDICPEGVANSSTSGKIYVASLCLSTISAINSSTLSVADYITVPAIAGGGTRAAVTSLDGSHIYLSDGYENEDSAGYIRVINTANDTINSFYIGKDTYDLKLHPDGNRLYATNDHDGTVTAVDLTNNTVIATIGTGRSPYGIVINNAGTRAYVANYSDNTVSVIDVASGSPTLNTVLQTISVGNLDSPADVAVSADGSRLYVSNSYNVTISVFNTAGDTNTPLGTISLSQLTNPWPWGLAMQPGSANLWVLLPYASEAVIVDTAGDANTIVNTIAVSGAPDQLGSFFSTVAAATVSQHTPIINWATPAAITYGTALDSTQLNATASYNGSTVAGTLAYTPAAGTVLNAGANQTLSVTFTPTDTTDYTTATGSVSLTVSQATPTITWATPAAITWGTALSATQLDATANVPGTFTYYPQAGAYVNAGHQTLIVSFTPTDTTDYTTTTARVPLTVNQATPTIIWAAPAAITYGTALGSAQLNATDSFNGATILGTFTYTPASGTVLTAGANQTLSVTFTPTDATDFTTANKSVSLTVNRATPSITWATPAAITYGTALSAAQLNATASVPGTFAYSPIAGTLLGAGSHTLTATFTPTDAADYNNATATVTLTVNKATPSITWATPTAITYGTALSASQLNATASAPGTFAYSPVAGTVLGAGSHTLTATFTPTDAADYNNATATVTLTVNKATPSITWATPTAITYGTALSATQLNATASVPGTFAYSPVAGTVLGAGSKTLTATFKPTDTADYNNATATVTLTVNKARLLVSANNLSKSVGAANPALTFSYSGFVNGDTAAVLSGSPALTTTATTSSPAGNYPITVSQGTLAAANYSFTLVNGMLAVIAPPRVILTSNSVLSKVAGRYQARITITNRGTGTANGVKLNTATLGSATGSPLPQGPISIAAGGSGSFTVTFPTSAGADGASVAEKFAGVYSGGTFSLSLRAVTLP